MKSIFAGELFSVFYKALSTEMSWDDALREAAKLTKQTMDVLIATIENDDPTKS